MQIKKINNNKLKVILNTNDLHEKNIDIDSFLSNSIESQNLFFEILDLAEEKYDFNIENNKAVVEAISLDNNIFILTITKLRNNNIDSIIDTKVYCFENVDDFLSFYSLINKNKISFKNYYIRNICNKYFLILNTYNELLENILLEYATPLKSIENIEDILLEYGNI